MKFKIKFNKFIAGVTFSILIAILFLSQQYNTHKNSTTLRVAFTSKWGSLNPAMQNTANGSIIISHIFNSLVKYNNIGLVEPDLAKSWSISEDQKTFKFEIDIDKYFSDGSKLIADDFKRSWEKGLLEESYSSNHSMMDLMYLVEGIEDFKKTKKLSGIIVKSDSELIVKFKKPFRLAIDHLAGIRFAASKEINGNQIGTGSHIVEKQDPNFVLLKMNQYYKSTFKIHPKIEIFNIPPPNDIKDLNSDKIDILINTSIARFPECDDSSTKIICTTGHESTHTTLALNGLKGRIFSSEPYRQAMQYLYFKKLSNNIEIEKQLSHGFKLDFQFFMPFQAGRLNQDEVTEIISKGKKYLPKLIEESQKRPIIFLARGNQLFKDVLISEGVKYIDLFSQNPNIDYTKDYYKNHEADAALTNLSVVHGDPDGLYHALGTNGAIASKMTIRKKTGALLETGRALTELSKIDEHYKNVNKTILNEVPQIHLGFIRRLYMHKKDVINVNTSVLTRNGINFNVFEKL